MTPDEGRLFGLPRRMATTAMANAVALGLALAATALLVASQGRSVTVALGALWDGSVGTSFAIGNTLNKAAALLFVALGFLVAKRAGLISIGGEGQIYIAGMAAVAVTLAVEGVLPGPIALVLAIIAGAMGGAIWGGLAGWLRARFLVNEVIGTLLLNFVGINLVGFAVQEEWLLRQPITSTATENQSRAVPESSRLPLILGNSSRAHLGIVLAILTAIGVWWMLRRTVLGHRIRLIGNNPQMAERAGLNISRYTIGIMAMSGALAGMAGVSLLLGELFRLRSDFSSGYGFDGIAVALLAFENALGSVATAFLFGGLRAGGNLLEIRAQISGFLVYVIQGVVILVVAATARWTDGRGVRTSRRSVSGEHDDDTPPATEPVDDAHRTGQEEAAR